MASATISSSSNCPFETNSNNVRDDSFSSYLPPITQSFSTELANPSLRRSSFQTISGPTKRTSMDDDDNNEIDVFAAEKYFSGSPDVQDYRELLTSSNSCSSSSKNKNRSTTTKSRSSTCSDTSTNSHSILLGRSSQQQQQQPPSAAARRKISFLDVFRCCSKKNVVKDDAAHCSKLPPTTAVLQSESSSDLFEIQSGSIGSQYPVYEPSEASIEWSVATASMADLSVVTSSASAAEGKVRRRRSTSGVLTFGCARGKAVSATPDKVGALERYRVIMDLAGSASVARTVAAARPRRASLG